MSEPEGLVFLKPFPPMVRVIVGLFGLIPLIAPYELLIEPAGDLLHWTMIPFWIISLGATTLSAVFIGGAILGATRTVTIDAALRMIRIEVQGSFGLRGEWRHPFVAVKSIGVDRDASGDGPPVYNIVATILGRDAKLRLTAQESEAGAEQTAAKVAAAIGARREKDNG